MDVKQAIAAAKTYAREVFSGESASNLGVEEVEKDGDVWRITLGLSRPWDSGKYPFALDGRPMPRSYHVFTVSDVSGEVSGFRMRERA